MKHLMSEQQLKYILQFVLSMTILTFNNKSEDTLKVTTIELHSIGNSLSKIKKLNN